MSAAEDVRVARAVARGEQTEEDVRARMAIQLTDEQREAVADYVIRNDGSLEEAQTQVQEVWQALTR